MRILLTGSRGQLGTDLQAVAGATHEVVAHDLDLDITDRGVVAARVREVSPDLLVNAAAYTNVDGAESDELTAYRVNALGAQHLALACREADIPMLHVSTDFVFSGETERPYDEFDRPEPRGVYARSKYAGECYVTGILERYYLVRTSWLYGVAGGNFVKTMLRLGGERDAVKVVDDQTGCPTYSRDLAARLLEIVEAGAFGTYHLSNSGSCTWNRFASEIFRIAGMDTRVEPISTADYGAPAPRPRYSVLRGLALEMAGFAPLRPWEEALAQYITADLPAWQSGGDAS